MWDQLFVPQYDERARYGNRDLGLFSEAFTLSDFCQVKVFKFFTKLNRSLCSSLTEH